MSVDPIEKEFTLMKILTHPLCNTSIGAPTDMQDGSCETLPVHQMRDNHGQWSVSFWEPNADELAVLNAGGSIALHVRAVGRQHPVVGMSVQPAEPV